MRVANYYSNADIRLEERPIPSIGAGELLVKIRASGICGSDVLEWYRIKHTPRVLGHEVAGEVMEVGTGVTDYRKGDRIAASHHVPCYECHYCLLGQHTLCDTLRATNFDPGGFAEWIRLPKINVKHGVYKLPDNVSYDDATLIEPLACAIRGQKKVLVGPEQTVLVIGCGVSGLLHILLAKLNGASKVVACDLVDYRMKMALQLGADVVFPSSGDLNSRLRDWNEGRLADLVIVCAGSPAASLQALECAGRGGTVLFFALHDPDQTMRIDMNEVFWQKGLSLTSTYAATPENHREALALIANQKLPTRLLITHTLGLSEVGKGFELVAKGKESIKVVIHPGC